MKKITEFEYKNTNYNPIYFLFDGEKLEEGQIGFGQVRYGEGSIYTGSLIYVNGILEKYGFGEQNFLNSTITALDVGVITKKKLKLYKFVGFYDYRETNWICGKGIFYYLDENNKPYGYTTGYFKGLNQLGNFKDFSKSLLLPGFEHTKEIKIKKFKLRFDERAKKAKDYKQSDFIMVGDSWFEYYLQHEDLAYKGSFDVDCKDLDVVNFGVSGTTYADWSKYFKKVFKDYQFNNVLVNLGFNDLHQGYSIKKVFSNFKKFVKIVYEVNKNAKIYINAVNHSTFYPNYAQKEDDLNKLIRDYCLDNNITYIPCNEAFENIDLKEVYGDDGIHLNHLGYSLWAPYFLKYFKKR